MMSSLADSITAGTYNSYVETFILFRFLISSFGVLVSQPFGFYIVTNWEKLSVFCWDLEAEKNHEKWNGFGLLKNLNV